MKGLSSDIELAIQAVFDVLELPIDVEQIEDEKMRQTMDAKVMSFKYAKQIMDAWQNSPNAPSKEVLSKYVYQLVGLGDASLMELRDALRKQIDIESVDKTKLASAVKAKAVVLDYIQQLNSQLVELRLQMGSETFQLGEREFTLGFPERFARGDFYPASNYHREWYNEEEDAVMICPHGTKGKIIEVDGLRIQLPKPPKRSKMLFADKPKREQYWRRTPLPEGCTPKNEAAFTEYIMEEFRRRREGVWFLNNGEPVYLTGHAYFALQWGRMLDDGGYMDFRYAQLDMFYFAEAVIRDHRSLGMIFVKGRRTGFTYIVLSIFLNDATSTQNVNLGMTSQNDSDAKKAFKKFAYMFRSLPFFFRPVVKGAFSSDTVLEFNVPDDKSKAAKLAKEYKGTEYLNTFIDYESTTDGAYDGQRMYRYLGDECVAPNTKVMMGDLTWKEAKDIKVGDRIMSGDGSIQTVVRTGSGVDHMYRVIEPHGVDYVVNSKHRLLFEKGNSVSRRKQVIMTAPEYLTQSEYQKRITRGVKFEGVEYDEKYFKISPYFLGVWLGDGYSTACQFVLGREDQEIVDYLKKWCEENGFVFSEIETSENWSKYYISDPLAKGNNQTGGKKHQLKEQLEVLGVWGNKRIPRDYMFGSREQRLQLLAGIIDTDGYRSKSCNYVVTMSRKELVEDIRQLCLSLGINVNNVVTKQTNKDTLSYSVSFMCPELPCLLDRKKPQQHTTLKQRTKIDVVYEGVGEYVGFEITPNTKGETTFVLEGGSITLNCGKWKKPANYQNHWGRIAPTFELTGKIVGKAFIGSTVNPMKLGGEEFMNIFYESFLKDRSKVTGRTPSGLYAMFLPANKNMSAFTDIYGRCYETPPKKKTLNTYGEEITMGSIDFLNGRRKAKRAKSDIAYNEELRANPMTIDEAFRDSADTAIFSIEKINEQIAYVKNLNLSHIITRGNFMWKNGVVDSEVVWVPDRNGRFDITWFPPVEHRNLRVKKDGMWHPASPVNGCFGVDPFDIGGTVSGKGSKGAMSGVIGFDMTGAPSNFFFLEYVNRTEIADTFFEDVLMACVFYGMPVLIENNKPRILVHFRNRGYRGFVLNRPDKPRAKLSPNEKMYGGIPSSSKDIVITHASQIENFIVNFVGVYTEEEEDKQIREFGSMGNMYFYETLRDWLKFDITKREKSDLTISSGYALMGLNRAQFLKAPEIKPINVGFLRYDNTGERSRIIRQKHER